MVIYRQWNMKIVTNPGDCVSGKVLTHQKSHAHSAGHRNCRDGGGGGTLPARPNSHIDGLLPLALEFIETIKNGNYSAYLI